MKKNFKKIISLLLALVIIMGVMPLGGISIISSGFAGYSGKCGKDVSWSYDGTTHTMRLSGSGATYSYDWKEDNRSPFNGSGVIYDIVVEEGVTEIGDYLFYNCTLLKSVSLPESLVSIGASAFEECTALRTIDLKSKQIQYIGPYAFGNTKYCLDEKNHEDGLIYLGDCLICGIYPDENGDLKTIGDVTVKDGTRLIASCAFSHVNYDGTSGENETLTSVTFPKGLEYINKWAFFGCTSLTSVSFPCSIKSVGQRVFYNDYNIRDIYIPRGIESFEYRSYNGLTDCTIHYEGSQEEWSKVKIGSGLGVKNCTFEYNSSSTAEHELEWINTAEPTCADDGLCENICIYCGKSVESKPVPATGHSLTHIKEDATCTEDGTEYDICSECGNKFNEETIKATGHSYVSAVTKDATCTEKGVITFTCSCGDSYTEDIPLVAHSLTHIKEDATCTKDGAEYDICSECGNKFNETTIKATGHTYTSAVTKDATCTEKGVMTFTCSCGDSYKEDIPLVAHSLTHVKEDATCTKDGAEYDICSECGNKFNEETIKATGHSYTSAVTKDATCTEKGVMTFTCSCGDSYTEEIPLVSHSLTHVKEDANCTDDGTEYDICSECGNKFNEETIKATGHNYVSAVTKDATCTEKGVMTFTCSCGDSYTEEIPLADHKFTHFIEKPTCTEDGVEYDICSECGKTFNETVIEAAGHDYASGVCTVCGKAENWNYTLNNGTVTITGYTGHEKALEIPAEIGGCPVTTIAESAYAYNTELEYVSVPNSVFIIGKDAFRGCANLKEICISDSVSTICEGAFADCTSLAIVYIASVNTVLKGAFSNNDSRLRFIVPDGTKTASNVAEEGFAYNVYMYPKEKDGKGAIAVSGAVTLYNDLEYYYWSKLIEKYPYAFYLYFDALTFDGVLESDVIVLSDDNIDSSAEYLTMKEVYISINIDGRNIAFKDIMKMIEEGSIDSAITFEDSEGVKRTFFQKIGDFFENVFNILSKAINAIVRVFKKK